MELFAGGGIPTINLLRAHPRCGLIYQMTFSVVLVSGGLDSAVTAAIAVSKGPSAFLHVNYGQRTEARELRAFNEIADYYKAEKRLTVSLEHLKVIGGSSLTDISIPVPETSISPSPLAGEGRGEGPLRTPNTEIRTSTIPTTYVPFRH